MITTKILATRKNRKRKTRTTKLGGRTIRHQMRALTKACKKTELFNIVTPIITPPIEYENARDMIKRVESWMRTEGVDPYIKSLGDGHPIIDFQGLSWETDRTTNISTYVCTTPAANIYLQPFVALTDYMVVQFQSPCMRFSILILTI